MERPPKKPGGVFRIALSVLSNFMGIGGAHGRQPAGEFDAGELAEGKAESDDFDLSLYGSTGS